MAVIAPAGVVGRVVGRRRAHAAKRAAADRSQRCRRRAHRAIARAGRGARRGDDRAAARSMCPNLATSSSAISSSRRASTAFIRRVSRLARVETVTSAARRISASPSAGGGLLVARGGAASCSMPAPAAEASAATEQGRSEGRRDRPGACGRRWRSRPRWHGMSMAATVAVNLVLVVVVYVALSSGSVPDCWPAPSAG